MEYDSKLKEYIEWNIDKIDNNNFIDLYCSSNFPHKCFKGHLTQLLYEAGIDPLPNISFVPANFLAGIEELDTLNLPSNIEFIAEGAFRYAPLKTIYINKECSKFHDIAFAYAHWLEEVRIPNDSQLIRIGEECFDACVSLKRIRLPDSLTHIQPGAFARTPALEYCSIGKNTGLQSEVFMNSKLKELTFRGTKEEFLKGKKSKNAFHCSEIERIICADQIIDLSEVYND